jgi:hypothetical protein
MARGEDAEKNKALIPVILAYSELVKNGTYMFGTDEPTMLDVMIMPFLEVMVDMKAPNVYAKIHVDAEWEQHGGAHLDAYVAKFRAHPLMQPWFMNTHAYRKHTARSIGYEKGVKCQLTVDYLEDAFA